ncbi:MAG: DRTGG domain-containing protein [Planctomycetota bacterium]
MRTLFVSSVGDAAGKNMLIAGIGKKMLADKYRVGFLKPLANKPHLHERITSDEDALFFHNIFNLEDPVKHLTSLVVNDELFRNIISGDEKAELADKVKESIEKLSANKDVLLVKGLGRFYRGASLGLSKHRSDRASEHNLIRNFNWPTILIDGFQANRFALPIDIIDGFIMAKKVLGNLLAGVIFNYVPANQMEYLKDKIVPFLQKEHKIETLGLIPALPRLKALSIREIKTMLQAELLSGVDQEDKIVEEFCISTMNMENDIRYFRDTKCNAVIVSGDRVEIQLAALESRVECLILTGKLYPPDIVLSKAEEMNVPVLVVRDTSLETSRKIERLRKHFGLYTPSKIDEAIKLVQKNVSIKGIYRKLGMK